MKRFRILLGLGIVVVSVWLIVSEQLAGTSADATINAQLATLRSPIAGTVALEPLPLGALLQPRQRLGQVRNNALATTRLDDLKLELDLAIAEQARISAELAKTDEMLARLAQRDTDYQIGRVSELEIRLQAARERLRLLTGNPAAGSMDENDFLEDVGNDLSNVGSWNIAMIYAQELVDRLENELQLALKGVYLGDGYNDAPFTLQRIEALSQQRAQLTASLTEAKDQEDAISSRLAAEHISINRLQEQILVAPVDGVLFDLQTVNGENVVQNDPILTIVDCSSMIVTASVSERLYSKLNIGSSARFRPQGLDKTFAGTITRMSGTGAERIYGDLAVAPSQEHLERFDVTLVVPDMKTDPELGCAIGRTGRIYFEERPLDWLRNLF